MDNLDNKTPPPREDEALVKRGWGYDLLLLGAGAALNQGASVLKEKLVNRPPQESPPQEPPAQLILPPGVDRED